MILYIFIICISYISATVYTEIGIKFIDPLGFKRNWAFYGQLYENSSTVYVTPEIKSIPKKGISKSMLICGYTVHREPYEFLPFVVLVTDQRFGYAEIKLKSNMAIDSLNSKYTFQIEAYDCDVNPHFSERKYVTVDILQTQRPIFTRSSYHFTVRANSPIGTKVGTITAFERPDKMSRVSEGICQYKIVTESPVPFSVNEYGILTTGALNRDNAGSVRYSFAVEARDCKEPISQTKIVPVLVDVFDDCKPHWTDLPSNIDYDGSQGVVPIVLTKAGAPILHMCSVNCQSMFAVISVKLRGQGIRPANASLCDQDDMSLLRQEKLCGLSENAMDMLEMAPISMRNRDSRGYFFPGTAAITVHPKYQHVLTRKFTVMFWMRHSDMEVKGIKEQILCNTDGQVHNRHHFSLFLHNCKLIVLLRKEYGSARQDQYEPSEWRYGPLKEVCDNNWHHYAVMFNDGAMFLQIDGEQAKDIPQHLDDKPLNDSPPGNSDTTFTVGACYHVKSDKFVQYFKGHLASIKVIDGHLEAINNIRCVATCGEALLLPHIVDVIGVQSSVTLFSDSVVIRSHEMFNLLKMFSELSYINTEISEELHGSQMANRSVEIEASIRCDGNLVLKPQPQSIVVHLRNASKRNDMKNVAHIRVSTLTYVQGLQKERIQLFPKLKFIQERGNIKSLKSCIIRPVGPNLRSGEYLDWPIDMVINLHLTGLNNTRGLVLEGRQDFHVYEMVMSKMYYVTDRSKQRDFAVSCVIIDRVVTNEVTVTVKVEQNSLKTYYIVNDPKETEQDLMHQHGGGDHLAMNDNDDISPRQKSISNIKTTSIKLLWTILPCALIFLLGTVLLVVYLKRQKTHHKIGLPKTSFLINKVKNIRQKKVAYCRHPHERVLDDTEDIPRSEDDEGNCEEDVVVDNVTRITSPSSRQLGLPVHNCPVDV